MIKGCRGIAVLTFLLSRATWAENVLYKASKIIFLLGEISSEGGR
jgi:hypothetical protein